MKALKESIKRINFIYAPLLQAWVLFRNIRALLSEGKAYGEYRRAIGSILEKKEIVLDIQYGGLGDWVIFTSLPRLLKEQYGVDFYVSSESLARLRNQDTYRLCFEANPFFKGAKDSVHPFRLAFFAREKGFWNFVSDRGGPSATEAVEKQFGLEGRGVPELFYVPNKREDLADTVIVDENYVSGKALGWHYREESFGREARKHVDSQTALAYSDPAAQDLFAYVDMIASCRHFVTVLSGGAAVAAAFDKPFTVILPDNIFGGSVDNFTFRNSSGFYTK